MSAISGRVWKSRDLVVLVVFVAAIVALFLRARSGRTRFDTCELNGAEASNSLRNLADAMRDHATSTGGFTSDLSSVGSWWKPENAPRYLVGFATADTGAAPHHFHPTHPLLTADGRALQPSDLPPEAVVMRDRFVIGAVADLRTVGGTGFDVWTIDEKKNLRHLRDGCAR